MKNLLFAVMIFCMLDANAQNYLITFAGSGASTTVASVKAENITKGKSVVLTGTDVLGLTPTVGISDVRSENSRVLRVYPNPMSDKTNLLVNPPANGEAVISVHELTGKVIARIQSPLEQSQAEFMISGLKQGLYLVSVTGKMYQNSVILVSNNTAGGKINIERTGNTFQAIENKAQKEVIKGNKGEADLEYSPGDLMKFTGTSGIYSTVVSAKIHSDTTITFNFVACTDGSGNDYPVVAIGSQTWMAENLKTNKFRGQTLLQRVTDNNTWIGLSTPGYCWYGNDSASYFNTYGALYNWYAAGTGNLCPDGWHIPSLDEWTDLKDYLTYYGYGYGGSGDDIAKSLASSTGWASSSTPGTPGNDPAGNNASGFGAMPGGYRGAPGEGDGQYAGAAGITYWWLSDESNSTTASGWRMADATQVFNGTWAKKAGYSVRCLLGTGPSLIESESAINDSLLACYSDLNNYIEFLFLFDGVYSNNVTSPGTSWDEIYSHSQTQASDNAKIFKLWSDAYRIIYKVNHVISSADMIIPDLPTRYQVVAQAKAIRAYLFHNLMIWFGEIPLEMNFTASLIPRNSISEVLTQISQDATEASQNLPVSWPVSDKFRVPQSVARELLSRASLYAKNYSAALVPVQQILNSGMYALSTDTTNFSSTNTEVFLSFQKSSGTEFSTFFTKGSYVPVMRYTESVLTYAEAQFNTGNTTSAVMYINMLNSRRGNPTVSSVTNDDIFLHWKRELVKEGSMFATLKRFDKAVTVLQISPWKIVLPIPLAALNANPYLTQNPGY
jgi:uncharacterized protein (TIGR02145 family)